jgi:hypothetical protein
MAIKEKLKAAIPDHKQPSTMIGALGLAVTYMKLKDPSVDWDHIMDAAMTLYNAFPAFYGVIGGLSLWKFFSKE